MEHENKNGINKIYVKIFFSLFHNFITVLPFIYYPDY